MPTYDYACPACNHRFEVWHPSHADKPTCPACGAEANRLILSAPAVHGNMARGREEAVRTLQPERADGHGKDCPCCH
jgi:putative FmdB family regulatory protein